MGFAIVTSPYDTIVDAIQVSAVDGASGTYVDDESFCQL